MDKHLQYLEPTQLCVTLRIFWINVGLSSFTAGPFTGEPEARAASERRATLCCRETRLNVRVYDEH